MKLKAIYLRSASGVPSTPVTTAKAIADRGLEGDHHTKGGLRQVTILSLEAWQQVCCNLDAVLDPQLRRANLLVDGLDLKETVGRILRIGSLRIKITGQTLPCRLMDEVQPGLKDALEVEWRCGVYGQILESTTIKVGDPCAWELTATK